MGAGDDRFAWAAARVGTTVAGKYRLERLIGVGGMATVYAAVHRNGHRIALKLLHPELSVRSDIRARFRREGQAANTVNHPGAVVVIDDDVAEDGSAYLVMELLDGEVVEGVWERSGRKLPVATVLAMARELCAVLVAAHAVGIVHRDLKPENLFLTRDRKLKVLDFGLAQLRDATQPKETFTGMVFGTPAFMPPEQASGRTSLLDERTDLWSVGATMFTLLSGAMVHEGESAQHIVMRSATEAARSLATVLPEAHPELVLLVDRALRRDRETRWPSAAAMRDAIRKTSKLLLGDPDVELPALEDATKARAAPPASLESSDEPTRVELLHLQINESDCDTENTRVDRPALESTPDTVPQRPGALGAASDTPTEKRRMAEEEEEPEAQTAVQRPSDPNTAAGSPRFLPESVEPATEPRRRNEVAKPGMWSELGRALDRTTKLDDIPALDRTQLLPGAGEPSTDRLRSGPNPRSLPVRAPAPARSAAVMNAPSRASRLATVPAPRGQHDPRRTIARRSSSQIPPYVPFALAALFLALTPFGFLLARGCASSNAVPMVALAEPAAAGIDAAAPPVTTPTVTASAALGASISPPPIATMPIASSVVSAGPSEKTPRPVPPNPYLPVTSSVVSAGPSEKTPRPVPPNPYLPVTPPAARPTTPLAHPPTKCAQPFETDRDGVKHLKKECLFENP